MEEDADKPLNIDMPSDDEDKLLQGQNQALKQKNKTKYIIGVSMAFLAFFIFQTVSIYNIVTSRSITLEDRVNESQAKQDSISAKSQIRNDFNQGDNVDETAPKVEVYDESVAQSHKQYTYDDSYWNAEKWALWIISWFEHLSFFFFGPPPEPKILYGSPLYEMKVPETVNTNASLRIPDINVPLEEILKDDVYLEDVSEVPKPKPLESAPGITLRKDLIGNYLAPPDVPINEKRKIAVEFLNRKKIVFGIPSVYREKMYLMRMINDMIIKLHPEERKFLKIVILNGHFPPSDHKWIPRLKARFKDYFDSGMIEILELKGTYHKLDSQSIIQRYGDDQNRIYWRSKQVLDFAYLMEYCTSISDYYVQLEDDVTVVKYYLTEIAWFLREFYESKKDWFGLSFYSADKFNTFDPYPHDKFYGFIGQLFQSYKLQSLVNFLREKFDTAPVDWLMIEYLKRLEKDGEPDKVFVHWPPLFQHIGVESSLAGKKQNAAAPVFVELQDILDRPVQVEIGESFNNKRRKALGFIKRNRFVFAMPTVMRETNYLRATIIRLLESLDVDFLPYIKILILNAEENPLKHIELLSVEADFAYYVDQGIIEILELDGKHPQMNSTLREKFGDSKQRHLWRSKQSLDFAYLMEYAYTELNGYSYYIQMEDDIDCANFYLTEMAWLISTYFHNRNDWYQLSFYSTVPYPDRFVYPAPDFYGSFGQLYRVDSLKPLFTFIQKNFDLSPVDWLIRDFLLENVQGNDNRKIYAHYPSLFQHVGKTSSLTGKKQPLNSKAWAKTDATTLCKWTVGEPACVFNENHASYLNSNTERDKRISRDDRILDNVFIQKKDNAKISRDHLVIGLVIQTFNVTSLRTQIMSLSQISIKESSYIHVVIVDMLERTSDITELDEIVAIHFKTKPKHLIHRYSIKGQNYNEALSFLMSISSQFGKLLLLLKEGALIRKNNPTYIGRAVNEYDLERNFLVFDNYASETNTLISINGLLLHFNHYIVLSKEINNSENVIQTIQEYVDMNNINLVTFKSPLVHEYLINNDTLEHGEVKQYNSNDQFMKEYTPEPHLLGFNPSQGLKHKDAPLMPPLEKQRYQIQRNK